LTAHAEIEGFANAFSTPIPLQPRGEFIACANELSQWELEQGIHVTLELPLGLAPDTLFIHLTPPLFLSIDLVSHYFPFRPHVGQACDATRKEIDRAPLYRDLPKALADVWNEKSAGGRISIRRAQMRLAGNGCLASIE
jgi:hypothetical protein